MTLSNSRCASEPGVTPGTEADGDVDVVPVEIAEFVGDVEAQLDSRMDGAEPLDAPHQPARGELRVGRHLQHCRAARQPARLRRGPAEQVESLDRRVDEQPSGLGQPDRTAGAVEEHDAQLLLDLLDLIADGGRRQAELVGGAREIEMPPRRFQRPQRTRPGQRPAHRLSKPV
jgi:hypothetical protein